MVDIRQHYDMLDFRKEPIHPIIRKNTLQNLNVSSGYHQILRKIQGIVFVSGMQTITHIP